VSEKTTITPEEAAERLREIKANDSGDEEVDHINADGILIALLRHYGCPDDVIAAYEAIDKWYA
jgi:hypothetical protein